MGKRISRARLHAFAANAMVAATAVVVLLAGLVPGPVRSVQAQSLQEYLLVPGDTVDIQVLGEADLTRSVTIRPDGKINLPLVGDVVAAGLMPTQLGERITSGLRAYLRSPSVSVSVRSFQRASVYLVGEVMRPGAVEIQNGWTMMEVIASVGGVTPRAALTRAILIRRGTGQTISVDLERLLLRADRSANIILEPGDIIMVPIRQHRVLILGAVRAPGAYDLDEGARVLDALLRAGGPADRPVANNVGVIRTGADGKAVVTQVDMTKIVAGDLSQNISMRNGDIIYVPESTRVTWANIVSTLSGLGLIRALFGF